MPGGLAENNKNGEAAMRSVRKLVRKFLNRAGVDVFPKGFRAKAAILDSLELLLPNIDLVIDVGANKGQFGSELRKDYGYNGKIISFEPSPEDYMICQRIASADGNWQVYPWALGSTEGILPLNVARSSELTSFRSIIKSGSTNFSHADISDIINVPVRCLDSVISEIGVDISNSRVLLKSDTQGFDLEVFKGANFTISKIKALLCEMSQIPIYSESPDFIESIQVIREYGFSIAAISPVTFQDGIIIEFDCLMLRNIN